MNEPHEKRRAGHHEGHPTKLATSASDGYGIWWVIGIVALLGFAVSKCSTSSTSVSTVNAEASNAAQEAIGSAIATQAAVPVEKMKGASVRKGEAHLQVATVEGLAGEMIYSQNCYDALSRHFGWAKLDACGAFDMSAVQALGDEEAPGSEKETAWFQSETAAARYLKAAVSAGEDPDEADVRLSNMQALVAKAKVLKPEPGAMDNNDGGFNAGSSSNEEDVAAGVAIG